MELGLFRRGGARLCETGFVVDKPCCLALHSAVYTNVHLAVQT